MAFSVLNWSCGSPDKIGRHDVEIVMVLDRSGSMGTCQDTIIEEFNKFVKDQAAQPGRAFVTLAQFDDEYELLFDRQDVSGVPYLDRTKYVPRGMTGLFDAIGRTINVVAARISTSPPKRQPRKVVFVILTDGHENASKEYKSEAVKEMIEHCRKEHDWEFVFLGADESQIGAGVSLGVSADNVLKHRGVASGYVANYASVSRAVSSLRCGDTDNLAFTADDRK